MGRMDGHKLTQEFDPKVSLISMTEYPVETLFAIWYGSRNQNAHDLFNYIAILRDYDYSDSSLGKDVEQARKDLVEAYPEYAGENGDDAKSVIISTVKNLITSDLPPLEAVKFTFRVDDVPVAWRDQLVRDRKAGYWTQTSRTLDLSTMDVNMNKSIRALGGTKAMQIYSDCVETIRETYSKLMELGVPGEDIRLNPSAMIQRDYWMIDLRQLLKVCKKRVDWIAQATMWLPVISGVLRCIDYKDHILADLLKDVVGHPNVKVKDGKVVEHTYDIENYDRYVGKDPQPCDPLWLAYKGYEMPHLTMRQMEHFYYLKNLYSDIWSKEYLDVLKWGSDYINMDGTPPYDPKD